MKETATASVITGSIPKLYTAPPVLRVRVCKTLAPLGAPIITIRRKFSLRGFSLVATDEKGTKRGHVIIKGLKQLLRGTNALDTSVYWDGKEKSSRPIAGLQIVVAIYDGVLTLVESAFYAEGLDREDLSEERRKLIMEFCEALTQKYFKRWSSVFLDAEKK